LFNLHARDILHLSSP
jgi:hypothetical protein